MTTALQSPINSAPNEKCEKPRNGGREDDKKKEEKGEKCAPQIDLE